MVKLHRLGIKRWNCCAEGESKKYQDIWSRKLFEELTVVWKPQNIVENYAVSVTKAGEVVDIWWKERLGDLHRSFSNFFLVDKQNSCPAVVTGEAVNQGDEEGIQVPCTLNF